MDDCIFCKIVKGDIPSYKIYETKNFLAFLDIFPSTEGYTLVIPKKHFRWVWDVPIIGEYFEVCQKVAQHFQKVTQKPAVYSMILGEEVPHAHVRIIPDNTEEFIKDLGEYMDKLRVQGKIKKLEENEAKKIQAKYALK